MVSLVFVFAAGSFGAFFAVDFLSAFPFETLFGAGTFFPLGLAIVVSGEK